MYIKKIKKEKETKKNEFYKDILSIIWNIINDEDFIKLKKCRHHLFFNRYEHLMNVSRITYKMAKFFKADIVSCTLAWILHDFHTTNIKWYKHWVIAAQNALKFDISEKVESLIKSHMYPFGRKYVERYKWIDFWIVKIADFFAMCQEVIYSIIFLSFKWKNKIKFKRNKKLLQFNQKQCFTLSTNISELQVLE